MATFLHDICDVDALAARIADGLIGTRTDETGELTIYNYTPAAQYTRGAFSHHEVRLARGLIVDRDGLIVARAFPKFANASQHGAGDDTEFGPLPIGETAIVTEKFDGSLGIVFRYDGALRVATRGSFVSTQARWAQEWLDAHVPAGALREVDGRTTTLCVEILAPVSRVVVTYDTAELVALAGIDHATGGDAPIPADWPGRIADEHPLTLGEALEMAGTDPDGSANREGVVIRFEPSGTRVKIKFGEYLRLHRILSGLHRRSVWQQWGISTLLKDPTANRVTIARAVFLDPNELDEIVASGRDPLTALFDTCPDEALGPVRAELASLEAGLAAHRAELAERLAQIADVPRSGVAAALHGDPYLAAVFLTLKGQDPAAALIRLLEPPAEPLADVDEATPVLASAT